MAECLNNIVIYFLWRSNIDDEIKIQALFGKTLKYDCEPIERFGNESKSEIVLYRLTISINNDNNNTIKNKYRLRMSTKTMSIPTNSDDLKDRTIGMNNPYEFLFDVQFQNSILTSKGSPVEFWSQLCLYTYFLIKNNLFNVFNNFQQQFLNEFQNDHTRKLTLEQSNLFNHLCEINIPQIRSCLQTDPTALEIFLKMFGLLQIDKGNFKFDNKSFNSLASDVYHCIKMNINNLLSTIDSNDCLLCFQGLTLFMSIQMLGYQTMFYTFGLLEQINDNQDKQALICDFLLKRLIDLQIPIKNNQWINLFSLVSDKYLFYNCLDLVTTLDDYLIVLEYVIKENTINEKMKNQLINNFEKLINRTDFSVSLENILCLLKHLHPKYQTTTNLSNENLQLLQSIIKSNHLLPQKINSCLENLDINRISLESLAELFELDHIVSIINIDKTDYLIKTILTNKNQTGNFYTLWFNCFLCDKHYQNTPVDQENFRRLLSTWLNSVTNERDILPQIIDKIDTLLDQLQNTLINDKTDHRLQLFVEKILAVCFHPNLIYKVLYDICTKISNQTFLLLYEKNFVDEFLVNNGNKLKSMDDQTNPLYNLLELSRKIHSTKNKLLQKLISACTKLIRLNTEEIRYETFTHPSKKTCTYTVLFDENLADLRLVQSALTELECLWHRWSHIGLTLKDIQIWKEHSLEERNVFNEIWDRVRRHFNKPQTINILFEQTDSQFIEKNSSRQAIISALDIYCDKANDHTNAMDSLRNMLEELEEKPIKSVQLPRDLKHIEEIALKLNPFATSKVWLHFYNENIVKHDIKESQTTLISKPIKITRPYDLDSDDDDISSKSQSSSSASLSFDLRNGSPRSLKSGSDSPSQIPKASRDTFKSVEILKNVYKIFEEFRLYLTNICTEWKHEPIYKWIELFSDAYDVQIELEILRNNFHLYITKELIDILDLWRKRNFVYHVCRGCLNLATRIDFRIKEDDHDVLKTLIKLNENILGDKCSSAYQSYLNQYVANYSSNTLFVWSQYSIATELIDFVRSISKEDFDNLLENVDDGSDKLVSLKTVQEFQILKYYFDQVEKAIEQLRFNKHRFLLPHILSCFNNDDLINKFGNIEEFFTICSNELPNMKQTHSELTDKEKSKRKLIINVMEDSTVELIKNENFDVLISPYKLNFSDLSELRDRARLIEYSYKNKMKTEEQPQLHLFQLFINFVNIIETILNTLGSLYISGHPIVSEIVLIKRSFQCVENEFDDLSEFSKFLQEILSSWEMTLCEKYCVYPELTYFSCEQFELIEQYLYNKNDCDEEQYGYHLLKYIGLEPRLIRQLDLSKEQKHTAEDRLEKLGQILSQQRVSNVRFSKPNKIILIETNDHNILKSILTLCNQFHIVPNVNQLFYCTSETSWMEIRGFLYRCMYSKQFYQLIRPELLSISIQNQIIDLIRKFLENTSQELLSFGILTTKPIANLQLVDGLKSLQIIQILNEQDLISEKDFRIQLSNLIDKCKIVTSRITGLGKSHLIWKECLAIREEYIKFPINGDIRADSIAKRLLQEGRNFEKGAIHLDLGVIENYNQLNDLVNCLILFRSFCFGQIAITIPHETPIYIELDCSSHSNLLDQIIIFKHISSLYIDQINWNNLIITEPVLFVVNYLKAIKDRTILTQDIKLQNLKKYKTTECAELIQEYFFHNQNKDYITWTKVFIYISVFYKLFLGFSQCIYFNVEQLHNTELRKSRLDILQALLNSADKFTSISVAAVRKQQQRLDMYQQAELTDAIIRWDKIKPLTLIFSQTNDLIFVYKTETDIPQSLKNYFDLYNQKMMTHQKMKKIFATKSVKTLFPDYKNFKHEELFEKLATLSIKYFNKAICTKCFRQYEYDTLMCKYCLKASDPLDKPDPSLNHESIQAFQKRIAKIIENEYVITPDNYIKMLLVFLRVQSDVPVLIMGETGCGKTALINCLCRKILDDEIHVFRLHAGITDEYLLNEMNNLIIQAENLPENKHLWVFFDEFNTIFNISLLKEIICERTLLGKSLPKNMVFLGTCNPRRQKADRPVFNENIGIEKDRYDLLKSQTRQNFLYSVRPIPETMLEYIWDYGYLDQETEKTYIEATLKTCQGLVSDRDLFEIVVQLISESHRFFRQFEDVSSVSLRDVARFCRLYKWFIQYPLPFVNNSKLIKDSSRLALLLCYYFRLDSKEKREEYLKMLDDILCSKYDRPSLTFVNSFQRLLAREQDRLVNKMQMPSDMALNRALKENIFVLFSCILNRIPVFLCGKPGSSKTSAVQILMNSLKGLRSEEIHFQKLPELVAVTFQGTQNCTSKSIEQIFERADKFMKTENNTSLLPVIIFDEIGLAELSSHNPLKVLHGHLEIEECRFGFVGISNYRLDAAKMNRALYIACLDPDDTDLETTGQFLANMNCGLNEENQLDSNMIRGLSQAYFDLKKSMIIEHEYKNYFGLRDYYSLIKGIVSDREKNPKRNLYEIIYHQLIINFGGICNGYDYMWEKFYSLLYRNDLINAFQMPTSKELIQQCLINRNSRHLMIIVDRESTIDHVERYITTNPILDGPVKTLVGSQFEGDFISPGTYTDAYSTRVLMEIILHAETPITLVMRRMKHLYDNLYDLFNQNFAITGRKKYCRIALSSIYNPRCFVHDQFYCVILLNAKDVETSDPPFLNRFQKHYVQVEKLTETRQWSLTTKLSEWIADLPLPSRSKNFLLLRHLILPYSPDYVCDLVIDTCQNTDLNDEAVLETCKQKLIRACSLDFPLVLSLNNPRSQDLIDEYYHVHENLFNISQLISLTFEQTTPTKRIIYTYTHIYDTIDYQGFEQIREIKLSTIKTELELINFLKSSSQTKNSSSPYINIIRIDYHLENHLILSLKYNILNQWNELKHQHLWIIFHIQRNKLNKTKNDVLFNSWDILMIDDLNNSKEKYLTKDIFLNPSYEYLINNYQYKLIEHFFNEFIHRNLMKFRYEKFSNEQRIKRDQQLFQLLNHENDQYLQQMFIKTIEYLIKTIRNPEKKSFKDWREDFLSNDYISSTSQSFHQALHSIITIFYDSYFQLLIHHFESFNLINSYIYLQEYQSIDLKTLWEKCYEVSLNTIDNSIMNLKVIEMNLIAGLRLPYSNKEYQILKQISNIVQPRLAENEDDVDWLFLVKLLKEKSSYGEKSTDLILNNNQLLDLYYHDQLILFYTENKFQLSREFLLKLLTTNTNQSTINRLVQLIAYPNELSEILHIFDDGFKLFDENILLEIMDQQLISIDSLENISNPFYSIIFQDDKFHLISPNTSEINDQFEFDLLSDPFIEISLMNLIECILSPKLITQIGDIEQITSIFSSINQRVLKLSKYQVNNLEKLCSFMSLLRCIKTLNPTQSLEIFQQCCLIAHFDATFQTCDHIHQFIQNLERSSREKGCELDRVSMKTILLKLEIEFLRNWLVDHNDQYIDILKLINQTENNLWKYSSKTISFIVKKLDLLENIEFSYEQYSDESEEINQLDTYLKSRTTETFKIHRLFVNRIHLNLISGFHIDVSSIKTYLTNYYENFKECLQCLITFNQANSSDEYSHIQLIRLLAWLKFYCQLYSFLLGKNLEFQYSNDIDHYLTDNNSSFCSTLKLFTLKQILNLSENDLNKIRMNTEYKNITWLHEFLREFHTEQYQNERTLIIPILISQTENEYVQVNNILSNLTNETDINRLISICSNNQYLAYSFYLWFIKYYSQYANDNFRSTDRYRYLFQRSLSNESKTFLQPIGIEFLHRLCTNFTINSYFHLNPSMSDRDIAIRLVILNIFALTLSFKSFAYTNWINTMLFDTNSQMPMDYSRHLQSLCLFGLLDNNPIKTNMKDVRASVKKCLDSGQLTAAEKYIYQCSEDCLYLFIFSQRGTPNQKSQCPFCKRDIGVSKDGVLVERDPPQIKMSVEQGLQFIENYIENSAKANKYGYYKIVLPDQSTIEQKSDHLNYATTYRFLHLFSHSLIFMLEEFNYISNQHLQQWNIPSETYFQEYIEKDYQLLEKCMPDSQYCYVWLFHLLDKMLTGFAEPLEALNSYDKVIHVEKFIEKELIIPNCRSKMEDINMYKRIYTEYTQKEQTDNTLINYLDERAENNRKFPYLKFFNVTQIFNQNCIDDFHHNLKTMSDAKSNYPLTVYILEHISILHNIQYLYPIIEFLNYLRDKYNYRISREQATTKSIEECLNDQGEELFRQFADVWSKINLSEVRYGSQLRIFDRYMNKEKKLAFFSLNLLKDDSNLTLAATLQTISKIQNGIVKYFHQEILQSRNIRSLPIHMIEQEHLLCFDKDWLNSKILKNAIVINFEYGQSKDIIYDYEEIEMTLRSLINRLPLINTEKFRKIQYQFELYSENNALINEVRRHIEQKPIRDDERQRYRNNLQTTDENHIVQYLSSLDYIFTYIQNRNYCSTVSTIELFVNKYIHSQIFLNQNIFLKSQFKSLRLEYIIDLYELIEEIAFDKIFRNSIERKLQEQTLDNNQRKNLQEKFFSQTIDNEKIATNLRHIHQWISTLKRFMVRILQDSVDLNISLEIYIKRTDLWASHITEEDIGTIQIDNKILLKHTIIILNGLEKRLHETNQHETLMLENSANEIDDDLMTRKSIGQKKIGSSFRKFRDKN